MPRISIIIPVYKVERFLPRCVESLLAQTFADFELILVDDGSPDASGEMCDAFAAKDARVRVLHKANGGTATARNAGLEAATGAYLAFIDSDDFVTPDYLDVLLSCLEAADADISMCNLAFVDSEGHPCDGCFTNPPIADEVITGTEAVLRTLDNAPERYVVVWNKLFKRELFADLRFPADEVREDEFALPRLLAAAKAVALTHKSCYFYVQQEQSKMAKPSLASEMSFRRAMFDRSAIMADLGLTERAGQHYFFWAKETNRFFVEDRDDPERHAAFADLRAIALTLKPRMAPYCTSRQRVKLAVMAFSPSLYELIFGEPQTGPSWSG